MNNGFGYVSLTHAVGTVVSDVHVLYGRLAGQDLIPTSSADYEALVGAVAHGSC